MCNMMRRSILAAVFGLLAPAVARAGPVFEFTSTGTTTGSDISLGFRFTTNQAISVVALDAHVVNAAGNQVRLYDASGTTLASATVLPTDPTEGSPTLFYSHAITPVALQAGQTYYVAEDYAAGDPPSLWDVTFTSVHPSVTYGGPGGRLWPGPQSDVECFQLLRSRWPLRPQLRYRDGPRALDARPGHVRDGLRAGIHLAQQPNEAVTDWASGLSRSTRRAGRPGLLRMRLR